MFKAIKKNATNLIKNVNSNVVIVCASKYYNEKTIRYLYSLGITHFGESRTKDLLEKQQQLKDLNITWHFIGSLQTNKVKDIINNISYLHSLDRESLAKEINKHRIKPLKCFIQLNLANEKTKKGLSKSKLSDFYELLKEYDKIKPIGIMQMGVYNNPSLTKEVYKEANSIKNNLNLEELSIGMSNDYLTAIDNGATFIRIGSLFTKEVNNEQ